MKRALIAMSGGVDSSVAALLTQRQGYECIGATMKLYENETAGISRGKTCCSLDDVEDARSVAYRLGMKFYVFNFKDEFREKVIDRFVNSYLEGLTPNPCIDCNRFMKFGSLFGRAEILGCDHIVTGHYARITESGGKYYLRKAVDTGKDQSYVLYDMTQSELARTLLPLGEYTKDEVRAIAEENGFVNARKHDSQDICFVPDGDYAGAIERLCGVREQCGNFIRADGSVISRHRGISHYTIGQRKGLGISAPEPLYVCDIDPVTRNVTLGSDSDLFSAQAAVGGVNWISGDIPDRPVRCRVKIRYRQPEQPATVTPCPGGGADVTFDEPQRAITPGQSAVFYDGDIVLGGGTIKRSSRF